ncbi:MAG: UDP-N-acetylmuramoyl-tripeptide--D-alanyl-D-alanine ligase, partial [Pseudomonadota bacterium]
GSVQAAAEYLGAQNGDGWLVLGEMAELGDEADELHRSTGEAVRASGVARVFAVGPHASCIVDGFGPGASGFDSVEALIDALRDALAKTAPASVLIKGSRSMRMERVIKALRVETAEVH